MTKANQFLSVFVLASAGALEEANKNNLWFVSWNAPFLASSSGYGSEATSFLLGLEEILENNWTVAAGLAHGDAVDYEYVSRLPDDLLTSLQKAEDNQRKITSGTIEPSQSIFICHSEPGAWSVPTPFYQSASPCPWPGVKWHKVVGRTMFETDRLPVGWEDRLNQMDEVWVPTQHHKQIFERDGVTKPVRVVGQGIDVDFWNPERVEPLEWSTIDPNGSCDDSDYKFLSVFKWEKRKGPDVLLPSFWNAFPQGKGACLIIVTSLYHEKGAPVLNKINNYWKQSNPETVGKSPQGVVLLSGLPLEDLVRLYRSVDSFVLPSRGGTSTRDVFEIFAQDYYLCTGVSKQLTYILIYRRLGATVYGGHGDGKTSHCNQLVWADRVCFGACRLPPSNLGLGRCQARSVSKTPMGRTRW